MNVQFLFRSLAISFLAFLAATTAHAAAPALVSVNPVDGATQVPTTNSLVFVFDQDMDTSVPAIQSGTGYTGSFELVATGFNQTVVGTWGSDKRTLTITPIIQFPYATFTWTLNPTPGAFVIARIKSAAGVELPKVSGTFTTGVAEAAPHLTSSIPQNNAQNVATNTRVEFHFDTAMKKLTSAEIAGNPPATVGAVAWTGLDPQKFTYSWSADAKILYGDYAGGFPKDSPVIWVLNPSSATVKFESATSIALAADNYHGAFFTAGPESGCSRGTAPVGWGYYSVSKNASYLQSSDADPAPEQDGFNFVATLSGSSTGAVTAASITFPDTTTTPLQNIAGYVNFFDSAADRAALDAAYPAGTYTLRFTQTGQPERVVPMNMPADAAPVPKITNFTEAQSINPAADFTLHWNQFTGATSTSFLYVSLSDSLGHTVFQAPNACVPRPLMTSDTSVVIPANLLQTNTTYTGFIQFGDLFYFDTNSIPSMSGSGNLIHFTTFTAKTVGSTVNVLAPDLSAYELLPNGNPQFQIGGTVAQVYVIERSPTMPPTWTEIGSITIQAGGSATFEDTTPNKVFPLFYRAVAR